MFIKLIPLLKILAEKPDTSPAIPPPTLINKSERLKFFDKSFFKIISTDLIDFDFSEEVKDKNIISYCFKFFLTSF